METPIGTRELLTKAIGYRVLSVLVTTLVALVLVGDLAAAMSIGVIGNLAKFGLYLGYEWAWERIGGLPSPITGG